MKNMKLITLFAGLLTIGSVAAWAESATPTSGPGNGEWRAKWRQMTPEQKETFLKNHPKFAEWLAQHEQDANGDSSSNDLSSNTTGDPSSNSPSTSSSGGSGGSGSSQGSSSGTGASTPSGTGTTSSTTAPTGSSTTTPTTTSSTTSPPNSGTGSTPGSTTPQERWAQMSPEQKETFLKNHPAIAQKFAQNHPDAEQRLAQTQEAGAGIHDPGHPRVNEVNGREGLQQKRIAQGVSSGKLTPQEQAQLQRSGNRIQKQEANDLAKNDGHLTPAEKARLNHEENRRSHHIFEDKHDEHHD